MDRQINCRDDLASDDFGAINCPVKRIVWAAARGPLRSTKGLLPLCCAAAFTERSHVRGQGPCWFGADQLPKAFPFAADLVFEHGPSVPRAPRRMVARVVKDIRPVLLAAAGCHPLEYLEECDELVTGEVLDLDVRDDSFQLAELAVPQVQVLIVMGTVVVHLGCLSVARRPAPEAIGVGIGPAAIWTHSPR